MAPRKQQNSVPTTEQIQLIGATLDQVVPVNGAESANPPQGGSAVLSSEATLGRAVMLITELKTKLECLESRVQKADNTAQAAFEYADNLRSRYDEINGKAAPLPITQEMAVALKRPLPSAAITRGQKSNLSGIKGIYVVERLNEVFGINGWFFDEQIIETKMVTKYKNNEPYEAVMVVAHCKLRIPTYGIERESYGGNDNDDLGDAYKGACTDAMTKICSTLGIAMDVFKGNGEAVSKKFEEEQKKQAEKQVCEDCTKEITPASYLDASNKSVELSVAKLVENSQRKYKAKLCAECSKARAVKAQDAAGNRAA